MSQVNQNEIRIIRSQRKTISLSLKGDLVVVRAPLRMKDEEILAFVARHRDWIKRQLSRTEKLDLKNGAILRVFGRNFSIREGRLGFLGDSVLLPKEGREDALKRLLKRTALERMSALTERIARENGFCCTGVKISSARTRWGSCNSKRAITYSFRVAFLEPRTCEYIAVHELCHTVYFSHAKEFWELVGRVFPDWKREQKFLKKSPAMSFL